MRTVIWCLWLWHSSTIAIAATTGDIYLVLKDYTSIGQDLISMQSDSAGTHRSVSHQTTQQWLATPNQSVAPLGLPPRLTTVHRQAELERLRDDIKRSELAAKAREAEFNRRIETERLRATAESVKATAQKQQVKQQTHIDSLTQDIERQTTQAGLLIGGVLLLLAFVVLLVRQNRIVDRQKKQIQSLNAGLEGKVRERTAELQTANELLRAKNREIEDALLRGQKLERKRVAADLHDNLGGLLSAIKMSLSFLKPQHLSEQEQQIYQNLLSMTKEAYAEIRYLSHNLQPEELEKQGLADALIRLIDKLNISQHIEFNLLMTDLPRLDKTAEFNLYSICVELCNNILKHSNATQAELIFQKFGNELNMIVKDNGLGLNTTKPDGMGLRNIQARTEAMKGRVEIHSDAELGTTFFFMLPLSANFAAV